jgi:hypothetical protein
MRINDDAGEFIGVLCLATPDAPDSLLARLARGDRAMHERMDAVMIPARRPASIPFADLEASSELSSRLSSRSYLDLIGRLTDLISQVIKARSPASSTDRAKRPYATQARSRLPPSEGLPLIAG